MKKLLSTAALAGLIAVAAAPAMAQGDQSALKLDLGGYFRGYVVYHDQDSHPFAEERNVDIIRDTEVHFTGETTLDNGLTVGVHVEATADREGMQVDESYLYTSGSWGRVNFGSEDGTAYLLQVAAPSADGNVDGIRQYVNPVNYSAGSRTAWATGTTSTPFTFANLVGGAYGAVNQGLRPASLGAADADGSGTGTGVYTPASNNSQFNFSAANIASADDAGNTWGRWNGAFLKEDYAQDATRFADKLTYLSPVFNGFQAGVSYTPDVASGSLINGGVGSRGLNGVGEDDVVNAFGSAWELAARYEGQFDRFGLTLGAGYTHIDLEEEKGAQNSAAPNAAVYNGLVRNAFTDDRDLWNVGGTVAFGGFNFGALYTHDDRGDISQDLGLSPSLTAAQQRASYTTDSDSETWVLGLDYTTGPWKVGASYLNRDVENMGVVYNTVGDAIGYSDLETDRYSAGVTYTYGPGMTFRGSVHQVEHEVGSSDMDATSFLLGTQVNF